jgi:hypothetical protein
MQELALNVLSSTFVSGLLVCGLIFFSKTWMGERIKGAIQAEYQARLESYKAELNAKYHTDIETHKAELKGQHDKELERMRADLTILVNEHQIRFARIDEKRAGIVAETYARLRRYLDAVGDYIKILEDPTDPPQAEPRETVNKMKRSFADFFYVREIYFPKGVAEQVRELDRELFSIADRFSLLVEHRDEKQKRIQEWNDAYSALKEKVRPLFERLHDDFQVLIGAKLEVRSVSSEETENRT